MIRNLWKLWYRRVQRWLRYQSDYTNMRKLLKNFKNDDEIIRTTISLWTHKPFQWALGEDLFG